MANAQQSRSKRRRDQVDSDSEDEEGDVRLQANPATTQNTPADDASDQDDAEVSGKAKRAKRTATQKTPATDNASDHDEVEVSGKAKGAKRTTTRNTPTDNALAHDDAEVSGKPKRAKAAKTRKASADDHLDPDDAEVSSKPKRAKAAKTRKASPADDGSDQDQDDAEVSAKDTKTVPMKRMQYAMTSMTQLLNQMSLDEKHTAAARMRASEAERICEEARLARISKEAELMVLSNTYAQKILDTLSLAKELGIDPNDLRLAKDPLNFIQSKRQNGQATVPATSARPNPSQTPVRPHPSSGRSILPSPAQTPSHPSNDSHQNATTMPQTSPIHSAASGFPTNAQHVSQAPHIDTQASVPLQGQLSMFAPQGFANGFVNNAFANNGFANNGFANNSFQTGMSIFAPSNVFAPTNSHSFGTLGNSSFAPFATAGSFGTAPTNTITTIAPDVEMN